MATIHWSKWKVFKPNRDNPNRFEQHRHQESWTRLVERWNRRKSTRKKGAMYFIEYGLNYVMTRSMFRFPTVKFFYYVEIDGLQSLGTNLKHRREFVPMHKRCAEEGLRVFPILDSEGNIKQKKEKPKEDPEKVMDKWKKMNGYEGC